MNIYKSFSNETIIIKGMHEVANSLKDKFENRKLRNIFLNEFKERIEINLMDFHEENIVETILRDAFTEIQKKMQSAIKRDKKAAQLLRIKQLKRNNIKGKYNGI